MQDGVTALACATLAGYADIARLLLEKGATMDFEDNVRETDVIKIMVFYATVISCRFGNEHFTMQLNKALVKLCQL